MIARILLALQQPATWYAIVVGAGAFGLPAAWLVARIRARKPSKTYRAGWIDGYRAGILDAERPQP